MSRNVQYATSCTRDDLCRLSDIGFIANTTRARVVSLFAFHSWDKMMTSRCRVMSARRLAVELLVIPANWRVAGASNTRFSSISHESSVSHCFLLVGYGDDIAAENTCVSNATLELLVSGANDQVVAEDVREPCGWGLRHCRQWYHSPEKKFLIGV